MMTAEEDRFKKEEKYLRKADKLVRVARELLENELITGVFLIGVQHLPDTGHMIRACNANLDKEEVKSLLLGSLNQIDEAFENPSEYLPPADDKDKQH